MPGRKKTDADPYDADASAFAARYEAVDFETVHRPLLDVLPAAPARVLDVGAGSGRDAAWFAYRGHEVVAVEPSDAMRGAARERHADPRIHYLADRLPGLTATHRLGLQFDFILLSAVWMHVPPDDRTRAFRKLATLLAPKGRLALTLRLGPPDRARSMFAVSRAELERLAGDFGLRLCRVAESEDALGRGRIRWETLVFEYPDDDTGALPLLRHIVLRDDKSSTYKLALLRTLCRVAECAPGFAREAPDDHVSLPLGLVALFWLRAMKPLVERDLPQTPSSRHGRGLGFVRPAFHALRRVPPYLLRPGIRFDAEAHDLTVALRDATASICRMPAHYITFPGSDQPVFPTRRCAVRLRREAIVIDEPYLRAFGEFFVPEGIWRTLCHVSVWIEPVLVAEWTALMQRYAKSQGRRVGHESLVHALTWLDPVRDTHMTRKRALELVDAGEPLECVWSGRRLRPDRFDIDHCFPFSAWPCSDLWNLLPASRAVNQREKRDKLVSLQRLDEARTRMLDWWRAAWSETQDSPWRPQFFEEARASLPLQYTESEEPSMADVFEGVIVRRALLRQTQGLPEWSEGS